MIGERGCCQRKKKNLVRVTVNSYETVEDKIIFGKELRYRGRLITSKETRRRVGFKNFVNKYDRPW